MSKDNSIDRMDLIDSIIDSLTVLQANFPEQEVCVVLDSVVVSCKLGDAVVFEGNGVDGPTLVIDAR